MSTGQLPSFTGINAVKVPPELKTVQVHLSPHTMSNNLVDILNATFQQQQQEADMDDSSDESLACSQLPESTNDQMDVSFDSLGCSVFKSVQGLSTSQSYSGPD